MGTMNTGVGCGRPRLRAALLALLLLLSRSAFAAATVDRLDEKQGKVVPFLYDPICYTIPVVQVSINGRPPLPFCVDTGATSALTIDPWAVAKLGLGTPGAKGDGYTYATIPVQSIVLQGKGRQDDAAFSPVQAAVLDLSFLNQGLTGPRVAGLLGRELLGSVTTRFDFAAKTLTVFAYPHLPLRVPGATSIPLGLTAGGYQYTVPVTLAPGRSAEVYLDTGCFCTELPFSATQGLPTTATAYSFTQEIDGWYAFPELRLPALTLGTLRVQDVVVRTISPPGAPVLGLDILAGYRVTLDGPNRELTLEPSARNGRYVPGWSGIGLVQDGDGWDIGTLQAGSPARRAGVRVGDRIRTVGGRGVHGLLYQQVHTLLDGHPGRAVRVSLRRGRRTLTISWNPLDDFSAPRSALYGLTMRLPSGFYVDATKPTEGANFWDVLDVLKGSPADLAGVQAGDRIPQMDDLDAPSQFVAVTRAGRATPLVVMLSAPPANP